MSAPPIRIESKAWTDTRYTTLALELGLAASESDTALIRCAAIWRWQTEHFTDDAPTYAVAPAVVNGALKSLDGARALVAADLAELEADGRLRIRGGRDDKGKSRIDWLYRERERNRAKGEKRHRDAERAGGRFATSRAPAAHQPDVGTEPAGDQPATSSLVSGLRSPEIPDLSLGARAPAHDPCAPAPYTDADGPLDPPGRAPTTPGVGRMVRFVTLAVELLNAARLEINHAATRVHATPGDDMAAARHLRGATDDECERAIRHGVAVIAASVRAGREDFDKLRPGELFGPRRWSQWQAGDPALIERRAAERRSARGSDGGPGSMRAPPASGIDATAEALRARAAARGDP